MGAQGTEPSAAAGQTAAAGLMISADRRSSGKTMVSIGIAAALSGRGHCVQTFKKGPDYIDPMWLAQASGRPCYNLDPHLMSPPELAADFARRSQAADLALVEGTMGLFDGIALDGSNSNAALAAMLGLPVVLVLDTHGVTRGVAPLILGYQAFDPDIRIAGVVLNRVGGARHEAKLRAAVEHYTDVPVLGAIQNRAEMSIQERHLGLIPSNEAEAVAVRIEAIARLVGSQVDLERLPGLARRRPSPRFGAQVAAVPQRPAERRERCVRIGIARDRAFGFYYSDDLEALAGAGAELVPFDCLNDARLPPVDAVYLGGGFPESFARELEANGALRRQLREAIQAGLPAYAECGGLMYLSRSLNVGGCSYAMAGVIPADTVMQSRPVGRGYVELEPTGAAPWAAHDTPTGHLLAHEFHHSSLEGLGSDHRYAYRVVRGHGIDGHHDGLVLHQLIASYSHLRSVGACAWAPRFVEFVRACAGARTAGSDVHAAPALAT